MKKGYIALLHIFCWLFHYMWAELAQYLFTAAHHFNWAKFVSPLFIGEYIAFMTPFYINYFFIMPRYFKRSSMSGAWGSWLVLLVFFIIFRYFIEEYLFAMWFGSYNYTPGTNKVFYAFDNIYYGTATILMSTFLWAVVNWKKLQQEKMALAKGKKEAELNFLKSQVNPHFLFNTLNNIYSLVYQKSPNALPAIIRLSELMRFMTIDSADDTIDLQKEIKYIESFIELELLRIPDEHAVQFSVKGETAGKKIAPLLLIPFIENGFKHGILTDKSKPFIILITIYGDELNLRVSNKINSNNKSSRGGIGLGNVRKRLELLYKDKYKLDAGPKGDAYICDLSIKL